jgi:hypothetical protein
MGGIARAVGAASGGCSDSHPTFPPAVGEAARATTHCNAFRGVHKQHLHLYVATYEAMVNTKRVTPSFIRRMCVIDRSVHAGYT